MINIPKRKGYLANVNCPTEQHGDEAVVAIDAKITAEDLPVTQLGDSFGKGVDPKEIFWDADGELKTQNLGEIELPIAYWEELHLFQAVGCAERVAKLHKVSIVLKSKHRVDVTLTVRVVKPDQRKHTLEKLAGRQKAIIEFSLTIDPAGTGMAV